MIGIGINENIYLQNVEIDSKVNLNLTFAEVAKAALAKVSYFDMLDSAEVVETESGLTIRLFPPLPPKADSDRTEEKNVELISSDINRTKAILYHIAKGYYTADQLKTVVDGKEKGVIDPFRGTEINNNNYMQMIQKKEVLERIHRNMATDFVTLMKPHIGDPTKAFRLLLVRQSADKAYASLRSKYLDEAPFWESVEVPIEGSKLYTKNAAGQWVAKFTKYELDKGLDSAAPVDKKAAGDKKTTGTGGSDTGAPTDAASIFGGR